MRTLKTRKYGFTLVELMIVILLIFIVVGVIGFGIIGAICRGNEWFTAEGVLMKIKLIDANAVSVTDYDRHVYGYSTVTVKEADGTVKRYALDSNVLFNYRVMPLDSPSIEKK